MGGVVMAKKISKRTLQSQYEKCQILDIKASLEVGKLGRMISTIIGKDVDAYRTSGGEIEIREDEFSLPMKVEDILDSMEE